MSEMEGGREGITLIHSVKACTYVYPSKLYQLVFVSDSEDLLFVQHCARVRGAFLFRQNHMCDDKVAFGL